MGSDGGGEGGGGVGEGGVGGGEEGGLGWSGGLRWGCYDGCCCRWSLTLTTTHLAPLEGSPPGKLLLSTICFLMTQ